MTRTRSRWTLFVAILLVGVAAAAVAQRGFGFRRHTATDARALTLVPADREPPAPSRHEHTHDSAIRTIESNGVPAHLVGAFPNPGNPNTIREQRHRFRVPLKPKIAAAPTPLIPPPGRGRPLHVFGACVNGVALEPGAGEFWQGRPRLGWAYEPLGGAINLGLDANHAHVQPTGKYHYHGLPTGLLAELGVTAGEHSPLVGWAADGFPIYARYGYADANDPESDAVELKPSWRLKAGDRPGGDLPTGPHDGAFVQDYEYVVGLGDLDECNGREGVTPEFPDGAYAYFLTADWPVIPRHFRGPPVRLR
ncbi:MAG: YHYH protein [Planctomycetota bacterium]